MQFICTLTFTSFHLPSHTSPSLPPLYLTLTHHPHLLPLPSPLTLTPSFSLFTSHCPFCSESSVIGFYKMMQSLSRGDAIFRYLDIVLTLSMYAIHYYEVMVRTHLYVYLCVCVCTCVCSVCTYVCSVHVCVYLCVPVCTCTCMHMIMCVRTYVSTCVCSTYMYMYVHLCTHVPVYIHVYRVPSLTGKR